jgi:hypothetical protein
MPEPKWTVGDMWTYSTQLPSQPSKITTTIVIGVKDPDYSIRMIQPDGRYEVSSTKGVAGFFAGLPTFGNVGSLAWPLSVGQHWSESFLERSTNPPTPIKADLTVDAYELITVPAGTFSAFRLVARACPEVSQGGCASIRIWLSPQVKNVTKLEFGPELWQAEVRGLTANLVAYAVAP